MVKFCIVPMCTNSTKKTPQKLFFSVPCGNNIRKKWLKVMKRAAPLSDSSHVHCCEDHFDIENDMENYVKYKLVGGILKLKKDVVPHKFLCQKQRNKVKERLAVQKRRKSEKVNKILHDDLPTTSSNNIEEIFVVQSASHKIVNEDPLESLATNYEVNLDPVLVKKCSKKIQVCIKNKTSNKSTMTDEFFFEKSKPSK